MRKKTHQVITCILLCNLSFDVMLCDFFYSEIDFRLTGDRPLNMHNDLEQFCNYIDVFSKASVQSVYCFRKLLNFWLECM